uniref:PGG domain-containing protein n=1 Tax=Oryza meridionalis TaxID=40149 RepID=A0A0E0ECE8_9ORYZ
MDFGPCNETLDTELLHVLTSGDEVRMADLLGRERRGHGHSQSQVAIRVDDDDDGRAPAGASRLLGVTTGNGNTALHVAATRGHAALVCATAPALAATRNRFLDTPLHCAAKSGHRDVAACLLSEMLRAGGAASAALPLLRATNCLGATALHEAVRNGHAGVVALLMAEAPELASVANDGGVSPLYLAATVGSVDIVRALLRPLPDGTPSPASAAGPDGRTALHSAATTSKEIAREILDWKPEGRTLLTKADSSGRTPLHFAISSQIERFDVVELFLDAEPSLALVRDNQGSFPLHVAAVMGSKCPNNYYDLVDDRGRNFLHRAVEHNQEKIVSYICRDDRFGILMNAMDSEGNTPLHLAAVYGHPRMVSLLLETMSVDVAITNRDGLTAADLAYRHLQPGLQYFLNPRAVVKNLFYCTRAPVTLEGDHARTGIPSAMEDADAPKDSGGVTSTGTVASVLIATVTFAAALTVPGGYVADDHPNAGTAASAGRFAFRAFAVSDTMAFLCSIVGTCLLVVGEAREVRPSTGRLQAYQGSAWALVTAGAQFMVAAFAFAFGLQVALGGGADSRWLVVFVHALCSASVLLCFPGIWAPFCLRKVIWRRAGWRGLTNLHRCPSSLEEFLWCFVTSFLAKTLLRTFLPVLIAVTLVVAIVLNIAKPNC